MAHGAPAPLGYTSDEYFALVDQGIIEPDDRVELLDGVIVAMAPQNPRHAAGANRVDCAIRAAIGARATVRAQLPAVFGHFSVPEPDLIVVPGRPSDYDRAHPTTALLVIEVGDSSLVQDRITKARIYAAADVPEYWLIDLRHDRVEVFRGPDAKARAYRETTYSGTGQRIELVALPGASVAVDDLIPARE